jgi:hypothetical protein
VPRPQLHQQQQQQQHWVAGQLPVILLLQPLHVQWLVGAQL